MTSYTTRALRGVMWLVMIVMILLAVLVTSLRVALPKLNNYKDEIDAWVSKGTGIEFDISSVEGFWRNTHPSLALKGIKAQPANNSDIHFALEEVIIEFDLIASIINMEPKIADLRLTAMELDVSALDLFAKSDSKNSSPDTQGENGGALRFVQQLDQLLLRQLKQFYLYDSSITYKAISGDVRHLKLDNLKWENDGRYHLAEGDISVVGTSINSLSVRANFEDFGSLMDVSGDFFVEAKEIQVGQWLTSFLKSETGIQEGQVSFNSWLTLERSLPVNGVVEVSPSDLIWHEGDVKEQQELMIESGVVELKPIDSQYFEVSAHQLKIRTNDDQWPELDAVFRSVEDGWVANVSQIEIAHLVPLVSLIPDQESTIDFLDKLSPHGLVEDIRISQFKDEPLRYSASASNVGITQWELLPGVHHASAVLAGTPTKASVKLSLIDDTLPYGDVFQAPLMIKQGQVDIVWQSDESGWSLWADKVTAATPDLQVLGAFKLDFPKDRSPFLSFYAEADLYNASQTWRYLPTLALGQSLTDYLSTAIQGGRVSTSKLLWYGELGNFPYAENNGMFQALVGLKEAKFSFDTSWPTITDLQLDLLFQNAEMHLDSRSAQLMDITASRITGRIPNLGEGGHIEIEAKAKAQGTAVRNYMTSSPLVDSVGAALTAVDVAGEVYSEFQLYIPFSGEESRAWGFADLKDNHVEIDAPPMTLEKVSGRIDFDNDVVTAKKLTASLLNQSVNVAFEGENQEAGYGVGIDIDGNWKAKPLEPYLGSRWLSQISGQSPWSAAVDLQLNDIGFTYQLDVKADLVTVESKLPAPLDKSFGDKGTARLQASGNQETISSRLQLPTAKYQAEIDITGDVPVIQGTNLVLGQGSFRVSPVVGHHALVRMGKFDLDKWIELISQEAPQEKSVVSEMQTPEIPLPTRVTAQVKDLTLASINWHDVDFKARKKAMQWEMTLDSAEAEGKASYLAPYDLSVALDRLHIHIPALDEVEQPDPLPSMDIEQPLISSLDRQLHEQLPNLTLAIDDFWLQGYKVGTANVEMQRKSDRIEWKKISLKSGDNEVNITGDWLLQNDVSKTRYDLQIKSKNNSELMERFGISSGIQKAPFDLSSSLSWNGAPWSPRVNTIDGVVDTKFGKGVISDVSGAARLLGLFSIDSIIRKMQLDFTDVFDKGMAFNSITGSGELKNGVFVTNNLKMDAVAGEMNIRGLADLNTRLVDAEVDFTPDITSGIPVLTAFAVTPQTALYVLAITTVISPVVEVFTEVNYSVKGPLDSPEVTEISRSKGEYSLPKDFKEQVEQ